jgi:hypothetical protein
MTRKLLPALALAMTATVSIAAQTPATQTTGVTFGGCLERDSAGPTGTAPQGNAAANPATTQGAYKLVKVEPKDAGATAAAKTNDATDASGKVRDIRVLVEQGAKVDIDRHIGHKVELTGNFTSASPGGGTGGASVNPRAGSGQRGSADPRDAMRKIFMVTSLKMISACDAK